MSQELDILNIQITAAREELHQLELLLNASKYSVREAGEYKNSQIEAARNEIFQFGQLLNATKSAINEANDYKRALTLEVEALKKEYGALFSRHQRIATDAERSAREETESARKEVTKLAVLAEKSIALGDALCKSSARSADTVDKACNEVLAALAHTKAVVNGAEAAARAAVILSKESLVCLEDARKISQDAQEDRTSAKELLDGSRATMIAAKECLELREAAVKASHEAQNVRAKQLDDQQTRIRSELSMLAAAKSMKK
jgi:hypothetical protein